MTEPAPAPIPLDWANNVTTWCTACQIHHATTLRPLCPVCLDDAVRAER